MQLNSPDKSIREIIFDLITWDSDYAPVIVIISIVLLWFLNQWIFRKLKFSSSAHNILKPLISIAILFIGLLVFIISIKMDKELTKQIISLLAILLSAGIALSSTTVLGNLIAGLMNSSMKRFQQGDLIKIEEHLGRVTRKGIFHTEIQSEDGNFVNLPNMYVARHPVKFTRNTETLVTCTVSIGYDEPRSRIEDLLISAANNAKINASKPFVFITKLGDFSVEYKLHGFLKDSRDYLAACSRMKEQVLDLLHLHQIEILTPSFITQRTIPDKKIIGKTKRIESVADEKSAQDNLLFKDANEAGALAKRKSDLLEQIKSLDDAEKIEEKKAELERITKLEKDNANPS